MHYEQHYEAQEEASSIYYSEYERLDSKESEQEFISVAALATALCSATSSDDTTVCTAENTDILYY